MSGILLAVPIYTTSSGPTLVKHEDFNSAASGVHTLASISGWTNLVGAVNTNSDGVQGSAVVSGTDPSITYWGSASASLNQRVEFTWLIAPSTTTSYNGVAVRVQSGSTGCYCILSRQGRTYLEKFVSGTETELDHVDLTPSNGDKWAIEVTGGSGSSTRLKVEKDTGSGWTTVTGVGGSWASVDPGSYLAAGYGGVINEGAGVSNAFQIDEWYWYDV